MLYEMIIYQAYNFTMTSFPIMYYVLFDFEFLKSREYDNIKPKDRVAKPLYLMEHPLLFRKAMAGEYFTIRKFVVYLLYSLFHAFIIYSLCFHHLVGSGLNEA